MSGSGYIQFAGHQYVDYANARASIAAANYIQDSLPTVMEGNTRLWRGNRPGEVGQNPSFTNSLVGIALPFMRAYGGLLSYVDVPTRELESYLCTGCVAAGSEFMLAAELAGTAKVAAKMVSDRLVVDTEAKDEPPTRPKERPANNGRFGWDYL